MYNILLQAHSGFRYLVLILIILAIVQSLAGWFGNKSYTDGNRKINLFAMISAHIQFLLGIVLYFVSPYVKFNDMGTAMSDPSLRYWTVEHLVMMLFAIVLITVGHSRSKKLAEASAKHRAVAIFYGLATLIVIVAIVQSGRGLIGS